MVCDVLNIWNWNYENRVLKVGLDCGFWLSPPLSVSNIYCIIEEGKTHGIAWQWRRKFSPGDIFCFWCEVLLLLYSSSHSPSTPNTKLASRFLAIPSYLIRTYTCIKTDVVIEHTILFRGETSFSGAESRENTPDNLNNAMKVWIFTFTSAHWTHLYLPLLNCCTNLTSLPFRHFAISNCLFYINQEEMTAKDLSSLGTAALKACCMVCMETELKTWNDKTTMTRQRNVPKEKNFFHSKTLTLHI